MSSRTASTLASILSILLMLILAILSLLFEMIVLNGAGENQGMLALGISLGCLGTGVILLGMFAGKATATLIDKFNLNPALSVVLVIVSVLFVGGIFTTLSASVSILLAGIR
jgi:hypothetical protein